MVLVVVVVVEVILMVNSYGGDDRGYGGNAWQ